MSKKEQASMQQQKAAATSIGEARRDDLERMAEIFKSGQDPHHQKFPEIFGPADNHDAIIGYIRRFFKPRNPFRKRSGRAICWYVDGRVGGYLLYQLYETSNIFHGKSHWVCFVEDVAIAPDARGMGGASALMEHLMDVSSGLGHCIVSGHVWRENEASEALFKKFGFNDLSSCFYRINT